MRLARIGSRRLPHTPAASEPIPPRKPTARGDAAKWFPKPPNMLVSENVAQGATNNAIPTSTSRRRKSAKTSAQKARKLSPARLRSGPGAGIQKNNKTGSRTRQPIQIPDRRGGRRRISSPPRKAIVPKPEILETVSHALSWFSLSLPDTVDNHPPRAL